PASGADERHATLARIADRVERAVHAAIRTRRRDPESVEPGEPRARITADRVGRNPLDADPEIRARLVPEPMRDVPAVAAADDSDPRARCHRPQAISFSARTPMRRILR